MTPRRGFNFTEAVRQALGQARTEAVMLQHPYVGTEHILLGLIAVGPNLATRVIEESGGRLESLRETILGVVTRGTVALQLDLGLPYTSRAKKVLELAMKEASELGHDYVGTQHALLGLIREEKGIAAQVLADAGIDLDMVREHVRRLHAEGVADGDATPRPFPAQMTGATEMMGFMPARIFQLWLTDPRVAEVFAKHQIDVERLRAAVKELEQGPS